MRTMTTHPLPRRAKRNTIHTEHRSVHQSNRSLQGRKGPGAGMHWIPGEGVAEGGSTPNGSSICELYLSHNSWTEVPLADDHISVMLAPPPSVHRSRSPAPGKKTVSRKPPSRPMGSPLAEYSGNEFWYVS